MEGSSSSATLPLADLALRRQQLKNQKSTVASRRRNAVCVRRAYKAYGKKENANVILDGLNMTVPKGTIYGLLGASGCGKTTLLNCVVGRKRLDNGEIWVLGGKPGSRGSGVPGPRIGYMPQDIALYGEFTIRETFLYFGWICGMDTKQVDEKLEFLGQFLMLPSHSRQVKNLSGGQQRRVSFAAALIHDPELLILDEPTVGVDPILRQSIWDHLVTMTKGGNTTIILTTHYIDEMKSAHCIGLMRGGYFLAEDSPERLIAQLNAESLEDCFLKLSVMQNKGKGRRASISSEVVQAITVPTGVVNEGVMIDDDVASGEMTGEFGDNVSLSSRGRGRRVSLVPDDIGEMPVELPPDDEVPMRFWDYFRIINSVHLGALMWKNGLWMWRNVSIMLFMLMLPIAQIIIFTYSIGLTPKELHVAVKNYEMTDFNNCPIIEGCNSTFLSCKFIQELEDSNLVMHYFDTEEDAKEYVRRGKAWIAMVFEANYSESLTNRIDLGRYVTDWDVDSSAVSVYQDKSDQQISTIILKDLYEKFLVFIQAHLKACGYQEGVMNIPIQYKKPVYGDNLPNFTEFAASGVMLTMLFFLAVAITSGGMIIERKEGTFERLAVIGITELEMLLSHVISDFILVLAQNASNIVIAFYVLGLTNIGNVGTIFFLMTLNGLCGMCYGFVISCVCDSEQSATIIALGSFMPIVLLCGIIWPREGMHYILQIISYLLPLTKTIESLRAVLHKGWSIHSSMVYDGFIATTIWILIFLTVSVLILKFKKG